MISDLETNTTNDCAYTQCTCIDTEVFTGSKYHNPEACLGYTLTVLHKHVVFT